MRLKCPPHARLLLLLLVGTVAASEQGVIKQDSVCAGGTCPAAFNASSMLQVDHSSHMKTFQAKNGRTRRHGAIHVVAPALHYLKHWAANRIEFTSAFGTISNEEVLSNEALIEKTKAGLTADAMTALLMKYRKNACPSVLEKVKPMSWVINDKEIDADGVGHVLLLSTAGQLQYVAVQDGLLAADPKPCKPIAAMLQDRSHEDPQVEPNVGKEELLHEKDDPMVKDCVALFHRTVRETCNKDYDVEVQSATLHIIDGFAVKMMVKLSGENGKITKHDPVCEFKVPQTEVAQLWQTDVGKHDDLPEEKKGLRATLQMNVDDLCKADEADSVGKDDAKTMALMDEYKMGYLPAYLGYEVPQTPTDEFSGVSFDRMLPEYDFRWNLHMCAPKAGRGLVRQQGMCNSGWAFAVATSLMNNICSSGLGKDSMKSKTERHEVSTQQIMSCSKDPWGKNRGNVYMCDWGEQGKNSKIAPCWGDKEPGKDKPLGCKGGHLWGAATALEKGIGKEMDFPYKCGKGDAKAHFLKSKNTCTEPPWGAQCSQWPGPNPKWHWDPAYNGAGGEKNMMKYMNLGASLYAGFFVHANFFEVKKEIYDSDGGTEKKGGHMATVLGYGVQDGKKYWTVLRREKKQRNNLARKQYSGFRR
eukprot:gnl/TRDRNA2_/TRDRNA2_176919_c0_seq9.p1 gnl/TRDRNA2_/TRDRNA2_176919_c0~~gnl/TRDRNA2_/TRDRNA2_176919_c0_seq9.p1  ORF type:complete len:643 (-),score=103.80 gnl/TRDRNA2_/TRDRNA2_176919_c0_seq9:64-1992(-)